MLPERHQTSSKSFSSQSLEPQEGKLSSVQLLSHVRLFVISWTCQASLSITNSWSLLKLTFIKSVVPFNRLIHCRHLLLLSSVFPSIRVFSNELVLSFLSQIIPGESANAVPHYHKLCSRVSHIWGNRRGQHIWSAMDKPRPGKTTFVIMVSPLPGKYELELLSGTSPSNSAHYRVMVNYIPSSFGLRWETEGLFI